MSLKNYLSSQQKPDHVALSYITVNVILNKNNIDLKSVYDKLEVSSNLQFVFYAGKFKHVKETSKYIEHVIARVTANIDTLKSFTEFIIIKSEACEIQLSNKGVIDIKFFPGSDNGEKILEVLLSTLETTIAHISTDSITFIIYIRFDNMDKIINKNNISIEKPPLIVPCFKFNDSVEYTVYQRQLIGEAKSFEELCEFMDFIKNYGTLKITKKTTKQIVKDKNYSLQISI